MSWLVPDSVLGVDGLHPGLAVEIVGDRIGRVCPLPHGQEGERLPGRVLLPGFVNAHSHAFQRALRGHVQHAASSLSEPGPAAPADSFWSWREAMYGLADTLDPDAVERISTLAFREMLAAGYTTVGEFHYLHHQPDGTPYADPDELSHRIVAAAATAGIRLVLLYVAYARSGFQVAPNPRQRRFLNRSAEHVLAAVHRLSTCGRREGYSVGLAPHSMRACPVEWLREFAFFDGVVHAHVDEQPAEIAASLSEHGQRPLHVFGDAGLLSPRFAAVHLTHPDDDEIGILAAAGASVVACPTTELDLGDGFLPLDRLDRSGATISIGSDSHAAIDPFGELRLIEWHARALSGHRNVIRPAPSLDGRDGLALRLLQIGAGNGARALGVDAGAIAPGKLADLITVDVGRMEFQESRLLPALVFNGSPAAVQDVWVGGRRVR